MKKELSIVSIVGLLTASVLLGGFLALAHTSKAIPTRSAKIRRTILLNFRTEASAADVQKVLKDVKANITTLKGVRSVVIGAQIAERAPFKYGISMDFDNEAALKAYRADEEHRRTHNQYVHLIEQAQITDIRDE